MEGIKEESVGTNGEIRLDESAAAADIRNKKRGGQPSVSEVDAYVKAHDIQQLLKDCIVRLCIARPDNPCTFLRRHFESLEKVNSKRLSFHGNAGGGKCGGEGGEWGESF